MITAVVLEDRSQRDVARTYGPEPTSCYSFRTATSASSTPQLANYSANSSSIPPATTNPADAPEQQKGRTRRFDLSPMS